METKGRFLVNTEGASSFMELATTETGGKAFLGDAEQYDSQVGPDITAAHITLRDAANKVAALVEDPTRTEVQKHEAAAILAERTVAQLAKSKAAIEARAESLYNTGLTQAQMQFAPSADRGALDSEIRAYIREQAGKGEGLMKIRQAMEDKAVAAVVFHSPSFLLDIAPENLTTLRFEATERHIPAAYKMMTDSVALRELPAKYDKTISAVRGSFYLPTVAAQASKRVQV